MGLVTEEMKVDDVTATQQGPEAEISNEHADILKGRQVPNVSQDVFSVRSGIADGGVAPWKGEKLVWWKDQFVKEAGKSGFPIHQPINKLTKEQYKQLLQLHFHI